MDASLAALYLDIYGGLLSGKQAETLEMRYNEDYSLSEIASGLGISRQAAHDAVRSGEQSLAGYEDKLGLVRAHLAGLEKSKEALAALAGILEAASSLRSSGAGGAPGAGALIGRIEASAARLAEILQGDA